VAGHSQWKNIKHRKAAVDKKRGKVWTKIAKAIIVAAKHGGPDPASNLVLRYAIDEARYANMPRDTIERNIKKGAGERDGDGYENVRYEGYGPGGVAIIMDALTDNRTRTANYLRDALGKYGGNLGSTGCVAYMFESLGRIVVKAAAAAEERVMEVAIEAGARDVESPAAGDVDDEGNALFTITTTIPDFLRAKERIEEAKLTIEEAQLAMIPTTRQVARGEVAKDNLDLIDALEDIDDVQKVYSNLDIPEDEVASTNAKG
jgi:YebC/PmpR family DNA-binding regulatory protein